MGVLPLQFKDGDSAQTLGLDGDETFDITGIDGRSGRSRTLTLVIHRKRRHDAAKCRCSCRIDTPIEVDYYRHGGILPFVLRELIAAGSVTRARAAARVTPRRAHPLRTRCRCSWSPDCACRRSTRRRIPRARPFAAARRLGALRGPDAAS